MYETQLAKLEPKIKYTTTKAFVPSFMEEWVFYQVSFDVWPVNGDYGLAVVDDADKLDCLYLRNIHKFYINNKKKNYSHILNITKS